MLMIRQTSSVFLLAVLGNAQQPGSESTKVPVASDLAAITVVMSDSFAALAPRLLRLAAHKEQVAFDASLAGIARRTLLARIADLAPLLGDTSLLFVEAESIGGSPTFALQIPLRNAASRTGVEALVHELVTDCTALAPAQVWHVRCGGLNHRFFEFGDPSGDRTLCIDVTSHGLVIGNSHAWLTRLLRSDHFAKSRQLEVPAIGTLRIRSPLRTLRTRLAKGRDKTQRVLQLMLDALGRGSATFEVEIDAIERLATMLGR